MNLIFAAKGVKKETIKANSFDLTRAAVSRSLVSQDGTSSRLNIYNSWKQTILHKLSCIIVKNNSLNKDANNTF